MARLRKILRFLGFWFREDIKRKDRYEVRYDDFDFGVWYIRDRKYNIAAGSNYTSEEVAQERCDYMNNYERERLDNANHKKRS